MSHPEDRMTRAAILQATGTPLNAVRESLGLDPDEFEEWQHNRTYRELVQNEQERPINRMREMVRDTGEIALTTLIECVKDKKAPWRERTQAANKPISIQENRGNPLNPCLMKVLPPDMCEDFGLPDCY
ncbi:hypothetical protein [Thiorhodococcus minor]|uniref:Uncharacterized protein n=1 Tax=Thiorhodococcus minor TaxID=57489 RepID=A0A6M0K686_9GAMM|nr:hypothetical protein [Thiorhodococcus minor]NEV65262.1 hypothetical protein [Thiorhodococcus minor]